MQTMDEAREHCRFVGKDIGRWSRAAKTSARG